jgi:transposase-like protein
MPGRKWTGEEKANIVLEISTTSTPTAEICRRYNVRPTLVYSWKASFVQAGTRGLSGTADGWYYLFSILDCYT